MRLQAYLGAGLAGMITMGVAQAQEEPFGQGFQGWNFTQAKGSDHINCRANFKDNTISISTNRRIYVSTSSNGFAKGFEEQGNIKVGGENELVQIRSGGNGGRLSTIIDERLLKMIVQHGSYTLSALNNSKTVQFPSSVGEAEKRLRECVRANKS